MYFIAFIIFLLGLSLGSFANSLIWRLANDISFKGFSQCPKCRQKLYFYDNIPLFSFLFLKGRCRFCSKNISWQYPLVEFIMGFLFLLIFLNAFEFQIVNLVDMWETLRSGLIWGLARDLLAVFLLTIIFIFDFKYLLIPVNLLLIFAPLFWLFNILDGTVWWWPLLAALGVGIFFLFQFLITKGKGLGEGDIWLGTTLGFLFPIYQELIVVILLSYFIGSLVGIFFIIFKKKNWQTKMPLGTFLVIASIFVIFFGENIWQIYWKFFL
jgi:prepilin signal peptidase PulO-like enzyme (type II secretory pathway)